MKVNRGRKEIRNYSNHNALSIHTALSTCVKLSKNKFKKGLKILHLQNITTKKNKDLWKSVIHIKIENKEITNKELIREGV